MAAQRFRILQKVNDLRIIDSSGHAERLSAEDREKLYRFLDTKGTQSFAAARKELGLPKGYIFNFEEGGEKYLKGNQTQSSMLKVFGNFWYEFTEGKQHQIIENWRNSESDETLLQEAIEHLGLNQEEAKILVNEKASPDYCSLSLKAIHRLLPLMMEGVSFKTAEAAIYGDRLSGLPVYDKIPEVRKVLPTLANPAVERAMTEMRKVVNSIIREHGKPYEIRIELARELKKPRSERAKDVDRNKKREKERSLVAKKILEEFNISNPNQALIEKGMLFEECGGICPIYRHEHPLLQFDQRLRIRYRLHHPAQPFPRQLLPEQDPVSPVDEPTQGSENPIRDVQGISRGVRKVARPSSRLAVKNSGKLDRFRIGEPGVKEDNSLEGFSHRQLNDTRYNSVAAAKLLATLYGGRDHIQPDGRKKQVIYATSGTLTTTLRKTWGTRRDPA